jgi:predicted amidohydrolase YtcJ
MLSADLIVFNANLITLDVRQPRASAMGIKGETILAVGSDEEVLRLAGPDTQRLDLAGKTVTPGFIDAHLHLLSYGAQLLKQADLVGANDIDDILQRLSELASRTTGWIQGYGFDQDKLRERRFPTRLELDRISRDRPILIARICGHAVVVNSAALALIDEQERAARDREAGLFTEGDANAFYRRIPALTEVEMEESILAAAKIALRSGITSVQTLLDTPEQMIGYARLRRKGRLPIRVVGMPPYDAVEQLHRHGINSTFGDDHLRFGACKLFSDGSWGAQTALLSAPYADKPQTRGIRIYDPQDLKRRCAEAQAKGFQLAIHAIGDQALRETLDAIEFTLAGEDNCLHRHRIEHASICPPDCLERMARLKIIAIVQPQFVSSDTWTPARVGRERVAWCYPFKSMVDAGVPIALSSDCPVEKLDAFSALSSAVNRHEWSGQQVLSAEESLRAYCLGSAYAAHCEETVGSLQVGKLADFVALSDDPTGIVAGQIAGLRAERVFVAGREVK